MRISSKILKNFFNISSENNHTRYKILFFKFKIRNKENIQIYSQIRDLLKRDNVIILKSTIMYESIMYQRPQHFASYLARLGFTVIFCNPDTNQQSYLREIYPNIFLTNIWQYITANATKTNILFIAHDSYYTLDDIVKAKKNKNKIIYDYIDAIESSLTYNYDVVADRHDKALKYADIIIVTANKLYNEVKDKIGENKLYLIPNGVEYEHFHVKQDEILPPKDLKSILKQDKPIIGYHGALADWIDFDLIEYAANNRKEYNFVFIGIDGCNKKSVEQIKKLPNVHILGAKDYSILPHYTCHFDVGIIPFEEGEVAKSTNPIKMFEYMTAQKPVIVTKDLLECRNVETSLVAHDKDEFILLIDKALNLKNDPVYLSKLDTYAKGNTWGMRAKKLANAINKTGERVYETIS